MVLNRVKQIVLAVVYNLKNKSWLLLKRFDFIRFPSAQNREGETEVETVLRAAKDEAGLSVIFKGWLPSILCFEGTEVKAALCFLDENEEAKTEPIKDIIWVKDLLQARELNLNSEIWGGVFFNQAQNSVKDNKYFQS